MTMRLTPRVTVLYVDDDRANLVAFRAMAEDLYEVLTAKSGEDALKVLEERKDIAILITDQRMPGMSGADLCERARHSHPDTIRMLVTAYSDLSAAIDAINRGHVSKYLRKPWNPDELLTALREAGELHRLLTMVQQLQVRIAETERMYALGVLVAGIGHELRNPLSWITTNLMFSRRALSGAIDQAAKGDGVGAAAAMREVEAALSDASEGAQRVQEIVDGISLSSRGEVGAGTAPVDLVQVVRSIVRIVQGEVLHRGRMIVTCEATPVVQGSATRIGQVLLNLVVNALQALPTRPHEENQITISVTESRGEACIAVQDNGVGIEAQVLPRIFDPFFTTKGYGTGLGLAISRQIVEEMGGRIEVESQLRSGTRFRVILPVLSDSAQ